MVLEKLGRIGDGRKGGKSLLSCICFSSVSVFSFFFVLFSCFYVISSCPCCFDHMEVIIVVVKGG